MVKSKKNWLITIVVFVLFITAFRLLWMNFLTTLDYKESPSVQQGQLDLRGWEFNERQTLTLNGVWKFYPSAFLFDNQNGQPNPDARPQPEDIVVPGSWGASLAYNDPSFHFGTYRLQLLLDADSDHAFGLKLPTIGNASAVFVNGQLLAHAGQPSSESDRHESQNIPYTVTLPPGVDLLDIVIQVSHNAGDSGINEPVRFGTIDAIQVRNSLSIGLQLLLCVVFLLNGLFGLIIYLLGVNNKGLNVFSLLMVFAFFSVLMSGDRLLFQWLDIDYEWQITIGYLTYAGIAALIPTLFNNLFPPALSRKVWKGVAAYFLAYGLFIVSSPSSYVQAASKVMLLTYLISVVLCIYILLKAVKEKEDVIYLLLASISVTINVVWASIMINSTQIEILPYPFDLIFAMFSFAAFWFKRFFHATQKTSLLAEKLIREDKKKDEFLVNTSHELRNPLHAISNMLQVILDDPSAPAHPKHRERVEMIKQVCNRMTLMLDDLIDITRLKEKTVPLELKPVYLQSVAAGVIDMIRVMLAGKPIQLSVEIDDAFPAVHADENRVVQILFNLLHNAVKFTDKGSIVLRVRRLDHMAEVQIEDTGIGISEDALQSIFLPYEQADIHSNRASGGFGLGLGICKQLVELHHGTLTAESALGEGSRFRFTLPMADRSVPAVEIRALPVKDTSMIGYVDAAESVVAEAAEPPLRAIEAKLLIVDDDPVNLNVLTQTLESEGYAITGVTSAEQALIELDGERYDLVITDVMMPQTSGYELTRLVRERFPVSELPILLLTARVRTEDIVTGFQAGANDYIKKPVDAWELRARVRSLIQLKLSIEERLRLESAWLQSQIQPHFLYNTLNSIAALGVIDFEKMQSLLYEFSNYLRLSFDFKNASPRVTLKHELSLVHSYLYIEKERFGNRINVDWDIEEGIDVLIPPLTIQPLVENAIKHGLMGRKRGGTVSISIRKQVNHVEFAVSDDGVGMDEDRLKRIFTIEPNADSQSRVGLINIERRLKQQFKRGLHVESSLNQGTSVRFQIPYG